MICNLYKMMKNAPPFVLRSHEPRCGYCQKISDTPTPLPSLRYYYHYNSMIIIVILYFFNDKKYGICITIVFLVVVVTLFF